MPESEIRKLVRQLGASINETLSESPGINESIRVIRAAGYEVYLSIEARIGARSPAEGERTVAGREPVRLTITEDDAKFLKALKISVDDPV
ncbi:MAG: hypothetical protein GXY47_05295 [Acidobacteria bacterium]|jgi:hypothetical protein|nr:hypothetical protein [Acidobacteriota bacterium]